MHFSPACQTTPSSSRYSLKDLYSQHKLNVARVVIGGPAVNGLAKRIKFVFPGLFRLIWRLIHLKIVIFKILQMFRDYLKST